MTNERDETTAERWRKLATDYLEDEMPTFEQWWEDTFRSPLPDRHEPGRDD